MRYLLGILLSMVFAITAYAGFEGLNSGVSLKLFNRLDCSLGLECSRLNDKLVMKQSQGAAATFVDSDATPDVSGGLNFETNTSAVTITDFDGADIYEGQMIVVVSKGAITYDVTSSGIVGGTTDIITAAGDVTTFMYDGADWLVVSRVDQSDDLN